MCYLIAKDFNKHGCIALKMSHGKHLAELRRRIDSSVGHGKDIQLITISRPTAYGEYAPYSFIHSEEEFVEAVHRMISVS